MDVVNWLRSGKITRTDNFAGTLGASHEVTGKPPLEEAYAVYLMLYAPIRGSVAAVGELADFVEVLRAHGKDEAYSDEEWVPFLARFTNDDEDRARDLWDGLLCQP